MEFRRNDPVSGRAGILSGLACEFGRVGDPAYVNSLTACDHGVMLSISFFQLSRKRTILGRRFSGAWATSLKVRVPA
jgi:hypothetical protein